MQRRSALIVLFSIVGIAILAILIESLSKSIPAIPPAGYLTVIGVLFPVLAFAAGVYGLIVTDTVSSDDVVDKILQSDPEDWTYYQTDLTYTLNEDVTIRIEEDPYEDLDEFYEPWVENFNDETAYRYSVTVYRGSSVVDKVPFVSVDGHRGCVPLPDPVDHTVNEYEYHLGAILRSSGRPDLYDNHLASAGISVQ